jgi:hypothetical protein
MQLWETNMDLEVTAHWEVGFFLFFMMVQFIQIYNDELIE